MISNNILAGLVVLAIVVSLAGVVSTLNVTKTAPVGLTGAVTGTTNATAATETTIAMPTSTVNFGTMALSSSNDTSDNSPAPFTVRNDGSVKVNISVEATAIWAGTGATSTSAYYKYAFNDSSEGRCYNNATSIITYTNTPIGGATEDALTNLNFTDSCDLAELEISLTVPADEPAGAKSSTVTLTAEQA